MALIFCDSFDNYNSPAIAALGKWQTLTDTNSKLSITSGTGRNSTNSLKCTAPSSSGFLQGVTSAVSSIIVGFALKVDAFDATIEAPFLAFLDSSTYQLTVSVLSNGQIRFRSGRIDTGSTLSTSSASVITATNNYFYLEFQITFNSATGALVLHSNGVNVPLSASSGLNTAPSGNNFFQTFQIGGCMPSISYSTATTYEYDDLYMLTTTGGTNTSFLGDVRIACVFPNGAGSSTQFTPNGAATNWQCVNETSEDGDTTYVSSATAGQKDLYTKQATPATTGPIFGVQFCSVARKDDAGARSIANTWLSGATAQDGATKALNQTYGWFLDMTESDPATGVAWTKTGFDAAQQGAKVAV